MSKRRSINYFDETADTVITVDDLINTAIEMIESKTEISKSYLKQRLNLSFQFLGIPTLIDSKSHNSKTFLNDLLDGKIFLEITGLSSFQGFMEVNLEDVDVAAGYKTVVNCSETIQEIEEHLGNLNYTLLLNYLRELDSNIEQKTLTLKDLIELGLPSSPELNESEW